MSCNKEQAVTQEKGETNDFFEYKGDNQTVSFVLQELKSKNDSTNFTSEYVRKYGYPLWNETKKLSNKNCDFYITPVLLKETEEIEAILINRITEDKDVYYTFSKKHSNKNLNELHWMFDYFTQTALKIPPQSGLTFDIKETRLMAAFEITNCNHVYASAGGFTYDKGVYCWSEVIFVPAAGTGAGFGNISFHSSHGSGHSHRTTTSAYNPDVPSWTDPRLGICFDMDEMTNEEIRTVATLFGKMKQDCFGLSLLKWASYNAADKNIKLVYGNKYSSFNPSTNTITLKKGAQSNEFIHELVHAYQYSVCPDEETWRNTIINREVEAHFAQMIYQIHNNEQYKYLSCKNVQSYCDECRMSSVYELTAIMDSHGHLLSGVTEIDAKGYIEYAVYCISQTFGYEEYKFINNYSSGFTLKNYQTLTTYC